MRFRNLPDENKNQTNCTWITTLPKHLKCQFVKSTYACDKDDLVHAYYLLYCLMNDSVYAPFLLMILVVILFTVVGVIADDFICPLMAALASLLRLSESVAGVTILALANGTPDLMSAMTSLEQDAPETMFCNLVGGGLIDTTLVVGTIILLEHFKFQPVSLVRDCGFYLFSMAVLFIFYWNHTWTLMHSAFFIIVYIIYASVVLARYFYDLTIARDSGEDLADTRSYIIQEATITKHIQEEKRNVHKEMKMLWKDLWYLIKPEEKFRQSNICSKIFTLIMIPMSFTLKLLIPQFNFTIENNGWNKSLYMINVFVFPTLTVFCFNYEAVPDYFGQTISMGILFAVTVYITTSRIKIPRYHNLVIGHVFFSSFALVNIVVNSIISILSAIASKFSISQTSLPLTILAVGNCIGDFVTNVNLARSGLPRMAIAACYAGPLFNLVFDAGFMPLYIFLINERTSMPVRFGEMGPLGALFLFTTLVITMTVVPLIYFEARKSFAIFLFILYAEFIIFIVLMEVGFLYPLGEKEFKVEYDTFGSDTNQKCDSFNCQ